jgi:4-hydroxyphenylpyruvate dioxygenase
VETFSALASAVDLTLCLEFNWSPVIRSLRSASLVADAAGAGVGVVFDPAHYHCTPTRASDITEETVEDIAHVHVNDMPDWPGDLCDCNDDRVLPGQGHLDLTSLFSQLEAAGYDGYYSIELFDDELRTMPPTDAGQKMYEHLMPLCGET